MKKGKMIAIGITILILGYFFGNDLQYILGAVVVVFSLYLFFTRKKRKQEQET